MSLVELTLFFQMFYEFYSFTYYFFFFSPFYFFSQIFRDSFSMGSNLEGFNLVNLELSKRNNKLLNQPKRQSFAKLCEQA